MSVYVCVHACVYVCVCVCVCVRVCVCECRRAYASELVVGLLARYVGR